MTMKIRMLTGLSGPDVSAGPGDVIERSEAEAQRLIEAGFAEPVREEKREYAVRKDQREKTIKED